MRKLLLSLLSVFFVTAVLSQSSVQISGTITDENSGEPLIGVKISCDSSVFAKSDFDGNYSLNVSANTLHKLVFTYLGYTTKSATINVLSGDVVYDLKMAELAIEIDEVVVQIDMAKNRETPIAFSKINQQQIAEELGTRDLPMILNSTPGAYATEQGGGAGDARISVRGFSQQNVAVLVDGVPVNDMENGTVYWSNWDGLSDITRFMQMQRGLGASKLAIVSVGGTMNIVTKGIDQKMSASVKQEVNSYGLYKTTFGYNTGLLKGNWGITLAASRKWGESYADATYDDAWSYFFKVQKKFKRHMLTFGFNGAPQSHGQRTTQLPISVYDKKLAEKTGINYYQQLDSMATTSNLYYTTPTIGARGIKYNPNYGYLNGEVFNEKVNYYHKPQFNFSHNWTISEKMSLTNVLYASIGKGGGTSMKNTPSRDTTTGLYDLQSIYDYNSQNIASAYSTTEHASSNYLRASVNEHKWVGILSTLNYKINKNLTSMFGIDARYYKGTHYQIVYDLMGGDYVIDNSDKNQPKGAGNTAYSMKREGDKVSFYNDAFVQWYGIFGQVEYKKDRWSAFMTGSLSETAYQRVDYFKKKDLVIGDTIIRQAVGYGDTYTYNGQTYTNQSPEARYATTDRKWFLGGTVKGGANYNINKHHNVFFNAGYLNIAPKMNTVFDNNNNEYRNIKNQLVQSVELGYGFRKHKFAANVNLYYTLWKNKPLTASVNTADGTYYYNINGLNALHKGIEIDATYKLYKNLSAEVIAAIADWKTISGSDVTLYDQDNNIVDVLEFSAKNVHVGDAAQIQIGGSLRYEIIKNLYVKLRYTYFGKNYANFNPLTLVGANKDRDSWKMPDYGIMDFNFGYERKFGKYYITLTGGVMNVLNTIYITDAYNGETFDATSAIVYVAMGRRLNVGLKIGF